MTSNYRPDTLWPDGLQRERFLPAIAQIEQWLDVLEVDAGVDTVCARSSTRRPTTCGRSCRRRRRSSAPTKDGTRGRGSRLTCSRAAGARRGCRQRGVVRFRRALRGPRWQNDYLELARRFAVIIVSGIPRLGPATADQAVASRGS